MEAAVILRDNIKLESENGQNKTRQEKAVIDGE